MSSTATSTADLPPPAQIKLYGLFPTTRRRYITQLIIAVLLVTVLLSYWFIYWLGARQQARDLDIPALNRVAYWLDRTPWIVLVYAIAQTIEAWFVFRAFARKQGQANLSRQQAVGSG
jgi:hypothetical protein